MRSPPAPIPTRTNPLVRLSAGPLLPRPDYRTTVVGTAWRNLLITNREAAEFLTMMHAAGRPNEHRGTHLFVCPMPWGRGGRLHYNRRTHTWAASPRFETHPVYWVTWLGAAAIAAWSGSRLPTRAEAVDVFSAHAEARRAYNAAYLLGDTCPVVEPGLTPAGIHHLLGNVQIWCADGPTMQPEAPLQRHIVGAAWNTPRDAAAITAARSRYLFGPSRGVGIRLVRDERNSTTNGLGTWELAHRINHWIGSPRELATPSDKDRQLLAELGQELS